MWVLPMVMVLTWESYIYERCYSDVQNKVPISIHVGKPGIGKCFAGAFPKAFEVLFRTIKGLTSELYAECTEARGREERLKAKMSEMEGQLRQDSPLDLSFGHF